MGVLKRADADPTALEDVDYYQKSASTDTSGAISAETINFDEDFDSAPTVVAVGVVDAQGEAHYNAVSASSVDVDVVNGPASTSVTLSVVVAGDRK